MGQEVKSAPRITINNEELIFANSFTYLDSTISNDLSLNNEQDLRIGKACATFSRLSERVWENTKLTVKTKISVYSACVIGALLCGYESWYLYATREKRLNTLRVKLLGRSWRRLGRQNH